MRRFGPAVIYLDAGAEGKNGKVSETPTPLNTRLRGIREVMTEPVEEGKILGGRDTLRGGLPILPGSAVPCQRDLSDSIDC